MSNGGVTKKIQALAARFGIGVTTRAALARLIQTSATHDQWTHIVELLPNLSHAHLSELLSQIKVSKAELGQDLFVLSESKCKRDGFFVEFGAADGVTLSNTYLLETRYGWRGILAEPARSWQSALRQNRKCAIDSRCVWKVSGEKLTFNEVLNAEFSTIADYSAHDRHAEMRSSGRKYQVDTISLTELLIEHQAPSRMDYLSIDTEGSEFQILETFDFERFQFATITCEHNFTDARPKIYELLTKNGYRRVFEESSKIDDWYVHAG